MDIYSTNLELPLLNRGKVRDTYDLGDRLLMIATDRLSAFDVVFDQPIPKKGEILNKLSVFWFEKTRHIIENHLISSSIPKNLPEYLNGRSMLVKKAKPLPIECVVRGYISGGGFKEYQKTGGICGINLPKNLKNGDKLEKPIFTPSTKASHGHDINISENEAIKLIGEKNFEYIKNKSIELYNFGSEFAKKSGLILADTKFEFGIIDGKIILIDEAMTPDSSRYWIIESYKKGFLESLDKQYLRDYLEKTNWNKMPPAPKLPNEIINKTSERYISAYEKITKNKINQDIL